MDGSPDVLKEQYLLIFFSRLLLVHFRLRRSSGSFRRSSGQGVEVGTCPTSDSPDS